MSLTQREKGSRVMTEAHETFDFASFFLGLIIAFFVTFMTMNILVVDLWHGQTCQEQFNQADTASDSLLVVSQDRFCLGRMRDE